MMRRTRMARTSIRRKAKPNSYNTRERAPEAWWVFVKSQRCIVSHFAEYAAAIDPARPKQTPCGGVIEADHLGPHGLSHKGEDRLVAPICTQHHRERTDHSGAFRDFDREDMRDFVSIAIQHTHALAERAGVEIPDV